MKYFYNVGELFCGLFVWYLFLDVLDYGTYMTDDGYLKWTFWVSERVL